MPLPFSWWHFGLALGFGPNPLTLAVTLSLSLSLTVSLPLSPTLSHALSLSLSLSLTWWHSIPVPHVAQLPVPAWHVHGLKPDSP